MDMNHDSLKVSLAFRNPQARHTRHPIQLPPGQDWRPLGLSLDAVGHET